MAESASSVSQLAENIIGSEIIKLAGEVNQLIQQGEKIFNLTIGDFNPLVFPIPEELKQNIIEAYSANETNYPPGDGILALRKAVAHLLKERQGLEYSAQEILISGGARPLIYAIYRALVDVDDVVVFPVPSWNNNHYTYLSGGSAVFIETSAENNFMPTLGEIEPYISTATLLALCSPLNPTGTVFSARDLEGICSAVVEENNKRRSLGKKPLYVLYDQIYWALCFGSTTHVDPVSILPAMKEYTIYVDGISKSLSATGVRVGWSMGPAFIIDKMKNILSHIGAWAPKAEQVATANYLMNLKQYDEFVAHQHQEIRYRLEEFHKGFQQLKLSGLSVDSIAPQAAIYLTVRFSLHGKRTATGEVLETTKDITRYLLHRAKVAIVPFYAFGADENSDWYRLSVGTCKREDVALVIESLQSALQELS